jgi:threonine synthase
MGIFFVDYVSTRGNAPALGFNDALLAGLAGDGGLYVPREWPQFSVADIKAMRGKTYQDIAFTVMHPLVGNDISSEDLRRMIDEAYATFRHEAIVPLVQTGADRFLMELFHGPTLAFKDVAMQLIARLMDHVLIERDQRATIVGATSGDTGAAAVEAFAGRDRTDMFILFPMGRVSPVQQRQMTTTTAANVRTLAIEGNFDDCQDLVKAMFADAPFRDRVRLSGINSINWARIMAQIVYYFSSAVSLGAPYRAVSFTVPTGNFGDIFAGYAARRMGLPVERLVVATNENDILARAIQTGRYEMHSVVPTTSPSMDIQISSNFERLLFEALDRDAERVRQAMARLKQSRAFDIDADALAEIRAGFGAGRASMDEVAAAIGSVFKTTGMVIDPHTATGMHVAARESVVQAPMVTLATAHPAKFPDAVKSACGIDPALPAWLSDLMDREERFDTLPGDLSAVEAFILANARAADGRAQKD